MTINLSDAGKAYKVTSYRRVDQDLAEYLEFGPHDADTLYAGCSTRLNALEALWGGKGPTIEPRDATAGVR